MNNTSSPDQIVPKNSVSSEAMDENEEQQVQAFLSMFGGQLSNPASPFALLVRFRVKEGTHTTCEKFFAEVVPATKREPGMMAFVLHREVGDLTRFVMYECWRTLDDLGAHLRTSYITKLRHTLGGILDGNPEFQVVIPAFD